MQQDLTLSDIFDLAKSQRPTDPIDDGPDYGALVTDALTPLIGAQRKDALGTVAQHVGKGIAPSKAMDGARFLKTRINNRIKERRMLQARLNRGDIDIHTYRAVYAADSMTIDHLILRCAALTLAGRAHAASNPTD